MTEPTDLITQTEAARRRGCSRQAIHELVKRGRLKSYGKLVSKEEVLALKKARDPGYWWRVQK